MHTVAELEEQNRVCVCVCVCVRDACVLARVCGKNVSAQLSRAPFVLGLHFLCDPRGAKDGANRVSRGSDPPKKH